MTTPDNLATLPRRVLVGALLLGLVVLAFRVVQPFIVSIAWALILGYVTWPLYARLRSRLGGRPNLSAAVMTLLLAAALVLPLAWLVLLLEGELVNLYQVLGTKLANGALVLPESVRNLPVVGAEIQHVIERLGTSPDALAKEGSRLVGVWCDELGCVRQTLDFCATFGGP